MEDPFRMPPRSRRGPPPPAPPRDNHQDLGELYDVIHNQMRLARSLFSFGHPGPFQVGRYICKIDRYNGQPVPMALLRLGPDNKVIAVDLETKQDISTIQPKDNGQGAWGPKGEFLGFKGDMAAAVVHGPG